MASGYILELYGEHREFQWYVDELIQVHIGSSHPLVRSVFPALHRATMAILGTLPHRFPFPQLLQTSGGWYGRPGVKQSSWSIHHKGMKQLVPCKLYLILETTSNNHSDFVMINHWCHNMSIGCIWLKSASFHFIPIVLNTTLYNFYSVCCVYCMTWMPCFSCTLCSWCLP